MHGIIYRATNAVEHKCYIGQTKKTLEEREREHITLSKYYNFRIYKAIREYGKEAFTWEVLEEIDISDPEEFHNKLNELEIKHIAENRSYIPEYGYNDTYGGRKGVHTPYVREKISRARKGKPGRVYTDEQRRAVSVRQLGTKWSEESIEKSRKRSEERRVRILTERHTQYERCLDDIRKGLVPIPEQLSDSSKYVVCLETGTLYASINEIARLENIDPKNVATSCKSMGLRGCCGLHYMFVDRDAIQHIKEI